MNNKDPHLLSNLSAYGEDGPVHAVVESPKTPLFKKFLGTRKQQGSLLQTAGLLESEALQGVTLIQVKGPQAEILLDTSLMLRNRMLPRRVV